MTEHPKLERWECFRLAYINELLGQLELEKAKEWRERASGKGVRWQKYVRVAIEHESNSRFKFARSKIWKEYAKTIPA